MSNDEQDLGLIDQPPPNEEEALASANGAASATDAPERDDRDAAPRRGFVHHGAFHQERERRRAAESELAALRERVGRADDQTTPPDPSTDPAGAFKWAVERIKALQEQVGVFSRATETWNSDAQLHQDYLADARAFGTKQPDFLDAYRFLVEGRDAELSAQGIADARERARLIAADERAFVSGAFEDNESPAARLYALAKARGYQPSGEGAAEGKKGRAAEKIESIQRGQAASRSLSGAGGAASPGVLTKDMLADMGEEDYEKARKELSPKRFRQIMTE